MQREGEQLDDELWSPEHDWILQFDKLLGNGNGSGNGGKGGSKRSSAEKGQQRARQ